jgi:hypothetical protein
MYVHFHHFSIIGLHFNERHFIKKTLLSPFYFRYSFSFALKSVSKVDIIPTVLIILPSCHWAKLKRDERVYKCIKDK